MGSGVMVWRSVFGAHAMQSIMQPGGLQSQGTAGMTGTKKCRVLPAADKLMMQWYEVCRTGLTGPCARLIMIPGRPF